MKRVLIGLMLLVGFNGVFAASLMDKAKDVANSTVDIVGDSVKGAVDIADKAVTGRRDDPAEVRSTSDKIAADALAKLFAKEPSAEKYLQSSYGYAVFDSRVSSFGITTGFGRGVAVRLSDDQRTYMRMASAGLNLGMGVQYFQGIFFFPDAKTFEYFVDVGWDAGGDATGAAGKDAESMAVVLANGVRVYQLNEKGVMLKASLTGTRYWKEDAWN